MGHLTSQRYKQLDPLKVDLAAEGVQAVAVVVHAAHQAVAVAVRQKNQAKSNNK